jgi:hypothetical protein
MDDCSLSDPDCSVLPLLQWTAPIAAKAGSLFQAEICWKKVVHSIRQILRSLQTSICFLGKQTLDKQIWSRYHVRRTLSLPGRFKLPFSGYSPFTGVTTAEIV